MADNKVSTEYVAEGNHDEYLDKLIKKQKKFGDGTEKNDKKIKVSAKQLAGLTAVALATGKAIQSSVKEYAAFEKQMSSVRALLKPTTKEFEELSKTARDLGKSTAFSAMEAAEAFTELGKLGFDANQIMASSADVLNLAAAANTNMATAATAAAKTINQFNLEAEEAGRVADVIAKASSSSAIDIYNFQEAMKIAGGVASGFNVTLEDSTAAISALADAGLEGTMAGTGLSRMLVEMEKTGSKANKMMKQLGAEGKSLPEKLKALRAAGLSTSQIIDTFGQIAGKSAIALINNAEKVDDLADSYRNASGAAKEMADTQLDNLDGSLKLLNSAFSELKIVIGEAFTPAVRGGVELMTKAISGLSTAIDETLQGIDLLLNKQSDTRVEFGQNQGAILRTVQAMQKLQDMREEFGRTGPPLFSEERENWKLLQEEIQNASGYQIENLKSYEDLKVAGRSVEQLTTQMNQLAKATFDASQEIEIIGDSPEDTGGGNGGGFKPKDSGAQKKALKERLEAIKGVRAALISQMGAEDQAKQKILDNYKEILENQKLTESERAMIIAARDEEIDAAQQELVDARKAREAELSMALLSEEDRRVEEVKQKWATLLEGDIATKDQRIESERAMQEEIRIIEEEYQELRDQREEEAFQKEQERMQKRVESWSNWQGAVTSVVGAAFDFKEARLKSDEADEIESIKKSTKSEEEKQKAIEKVEEKAARKRYELQLREWRSNILMGVANTALAVTKTLTSVPYPASIPLAIGAGATGAAQVATIAGNKPRFALGSRDPFGNAREVQQAPGRPGGVDTQLGLFTPGELIIPPGPKQEVAKDAMNGRSQGQIASLMIAPVFQFAAGTPEEVMDQFDSAMPQFQKLIVDTIQNAKEADRFDESRVSI